MTSKVAVLTTIFPMDEGFICKFLASLEKQTYQSFDVVVVNDGYDGFSEIAATYKNINAIELPNNDTPSKNREHGLNYIKQKSYDVVVLADSDDYFERNRIEVSLKYLDQYDVVVNDLSLFCNDDVYEKDYLSNRFANKQALVVEDIKDKNFFGFSNTAFKASLLSDTVFDSDLVAVDWYFFSCLLMKGASAVFTNETCTYYRQYQDNTVGLGELTKELLERGIKVKRKHYQLMSAKDKSYSILLKEMESIKELADSDAERFVEEATKNRPDHPLWWETIKLSGN